MHNVKIRFAYKAGFRRLWLVLSAIWLIGIGLEGVHEGVFSRPIAWIFWMAPVILTYALGAIFVWVIEGFARAD